VQTKLTVTLLPNDVIRTTRNHNVISVNGFTWGDTSFC